MWYPDCDKETLEAFTRTMLTMAGKPEDELLAIAEPARTCACAFWPVNRLHTDPACVARWVLVFRGDAVDVQHRSTVQAHEWDIDTMRRHHSGLWFDESAVRFFRTKFGRVYSGPGGVYFVTSESDGRCGRRYSVRKFCTITGNVSKIGDFMQHSTATAANKAARALAGE